jgi:hypothetical protein
MKRLYIITAFLFSLCLLHSQAAIAATSGTTVYRSTSADAIDTCVYWFDSDYTNKHTIQTYNAGTISQLISTTGLINGLHQFNFWVKINNGHWSPVQSSMFLQLGSTDNPQSQIVAYEYWIDNDFSNKKTMQVTAAVNLTLTGKMLDLASVANGIHQINFRIKTKTNYWSNTSSEMFFKRGNVVVTGLDIKKIRYWFDSNFSGVQEISSLGQNGIISNAIDCKSLTSGKHYISYQVMDNVNIWSSIVTDSLMALPTGVNQISDIENIILYPNPTKGQIVMKIPGANEEVNIEIMSLNGTLLNRQKLEIPATGWINIDISNFANGTYIVKLHNKSIQSTTKIMKK